MPLEAWQLALTLCSSSTGKIKATWQEGLLLWPQLAGSYGHQPSFCRSSFLKKAEMRIWVANCPPSWTRIWGQVSLEAVWGLLAQSSWEKPRCPEKRFMKSDAKIRKTVRKEVTLGPRLCEAQVRVLPFCSKGDPITLFFLQLIRLSCHLPPNKPWMRHSCSFTNVPPCSHNHCLSFL